MGIWIFIGIVAIFVSTCIIYSLIQKGIEEKRENRCKKLENTIRILQNEIKELTEKRKNDCIDENKLRVENENFLLKKQIQECKKIQENQKNIISMQAIDIKNKKNRN